MRRDERRIGQVVQRSRRVAREDRRCIGVQRRKRRILHVHAAAVFGCHVIGDGRAFELDLRVVGLVLAAEQAAAVCCGVAADFGIGYGHRSGKRSRNGAAHVHAAALVGRRVVDDRAVRDLVVGKRAERDATAACGGIAFDQGAGHRERGCRVVVQAQAEAAAARLVRSARFVAGEDAVGDGDIAVAVGEQSPAAPQGLVVGERAFVEHDGSVVLDSDAARLRIEALVVVERHVGERRLDVLRG